MTLSEYITQWSRLILVLKKPASQVVMGSHARRISSVLGHVPLAELKYAEVQRFFSTLAKECSPKTVANVWSTLRGILNQAKREGLIQEVLAPVLPKNFREPKEWLSTDQMGAIVRAADPDWRAFYAVLAETGLRIGEAVGLRSEDVDHQKLTLSVRRSVFAGEAQHPKTSSSQRTISISPELSEMLEEMPEGLLFTTRSGRPLWPNNIPKAPLLQSIGITPVGFHAWRRGNRSAMTLLGVPESIAEFRLGHVLKDMYTQPEAIALEDRVWVERLARKLYR